MAEAPIHPPTASRVAEARAAGLGPQLSASGLWGALLLLGLFAERSAPQLWQRLFALLRAPLEAWIRGDARFNFKQHFTGLHVLTVVYHEFRNAAGHPRSDGGNFARFRID